MAYTCPVCGYPGLTEPPRTKDSGPSYEICPCCDYQFGYTDDSEGIDYETWRRQWIAEGMPWRDVEPAPEGWDPVAQLRALESGQSGQAGESGQAVLELTGLVVLVALLIATLSAIGLPGRVASAFSSSVGTVLGGGSTSGSPGSGTAGTAGGPSSASGGASGSGSGAAAGGGGATAAAGLAAKVRSAASNSQKLIDEGGNGWGNPSTLARHFRDHGGDFGSPDEQAYAQEAQNFLQRAVAERLPMKVAPDGTIRVYDPSTNTFGAYNPDGTTKTYFKPNLAKNPNYWDDQKGTDPWGGEPGGGTGGEPGGGTGAEPGGSGGGSDSGGGNGGGGSGGEPGGGAPPDVPDVPDVPDIPVIPEIPLIP